MHSVRMAGAAGLGRSAHLGPRGPGALGPHPWLAPVPLPLPLPLPLLLLPVLMLQAAAESPWGLPVVADKPASLAKVVMAELAKLKLDNRPWPAGTHSLHYHYLFLSEPGPRLPQFMAVGYVNDQPFIRFDSHVDQARAQAPWMAAVDAQYWETETQKQRAWAKVQQVETWKVMGYHNQSGGTHSTQRMFGCEVLEHGSSTSFWHFSYDGQDHLTLDLDTLSWVSAHPVALQTKRWWETESCYAEYDKAYLEGLCVSSLRRYLALGGHSLTRRESPSVKVTRRLAPDGDAVLKCWALGFYPRDISLSWWLGDKELALDTEHVETRPGGDGTYQTWAAISVPAGKEASYSCRVQHTGLNHTLSVVWEPPSPLGPTTVGLLTSLGVILLCVAVLVQIKRCWGGGGSDP